VSTTAYTAMKPDAPVTSTFDPDLIAGIMIDVDRSGWMEGGGIVVLEWWSGGGWRWFNARPVPANHGECRHDSNTSICGLLYMAMLWLHYSHLYRHKGAE
jgi:hypothetical protein